MYYNLGTLKYNLEFEFKIQSFPSSATGNGEMWVKVKNVLTHERNS